GAPETEPGPSGVEGGAEDGSCGSPFHGASSRSLGGPTKPAESQRPSRFRDWLRPAHGRPRRRAGVHSPWACCQSTRGDGPVKRGGLMRARERAGAVRRVRPANKRGRNKNGPSGSSGGQAGRYIRRMSLRRANYAKVGRRSDVAGDSKVFRRGVIP